MCLNIVLFIFGITAKLSTAFVIFANSWTKQCEKSMPHLFHFLFRLPRPFLSWSLSLCVRFRTYEISAWPLSEVLHTAGFDWLIDLRSPLNTHKDQVIQSTSYFKKHRTRVPYSWEFTGGVYSSAQSGFPTSSLLLELYLLPLHCAIFLHRCLQLKSTYLSPVIFPISYLRGH